MTPMWPIALALMVPLAACTTLGTNIKGSFACSAPEGICAPSSVIDDHALAMIAGESRETAPVALAAPGLLRSSSVPRGQVVHEGQKVLRIVFPAHIDARGRYHELSAVRAVVDQGSWHAAQIGSGSPPATATGRLASGGGGRAEPDEVDSAAASTPTEEAIRAARARTQVPPLSRASIAAEVKAVVAKPTANPPAGFPAKVEE